MNSATSSSDGLCAVRTYKLDTQTATVSAAAGLRPSRRAVTKPELKWSPAPVVIFGCSQSGPGAKKVPSAVAQTAHSTGCTTTVSSLSVSRMRAAMACRFSGVFSIGAKPNRASTCSASL